MDFFLADYERWFDTLSVRSKKITNKQQVRCFAIEFSRNPISLWKNQSGIINHILILIFQIKLSNTFRFRSRPSSHTMTSINQASLPGKPENAVLPTLGMTGANVLHSCSYLP